MMQKTSKIDCDVPRYVEVARDLQHAIETHQYIIGSLLPTEMQLQEQYQVSRCTVREALRLLRDQGYISSLRGSGSKVIASTPPRQYLQTVESMDDIIKFQLKAVTNLISKSIEPLPQSLCEKLEIPFEKNWLKIVLLRQLIKCQSPVMLTTMYIEEKYKDVKEKSDCPKTFLDLLKEHYQVESVELKQDICAIELDDKLMSIFDHPDKIAALQAVRQYYDKHHELFLITLDITPAGRYFYSNRMKICHGV